MKGINNEKKINNSKLDFKNIMLQHKEEYIRKRTRTRWQKFIGTPKTKSYLDFLLKRRRSNYNYPRFFENPLNFKKQLNKYFSLRNSNSYLRYEQLNEAYKHTTIFRIIFSRTGFKDYYFREITKINYRVRATKKRRRKDKVKRSQFGLRLGFQGFKTLFFKCFFPSELIASFSYNERHSLGAGPFTKTGKYFLDDAERLLIFHRYYLQQYKEYLFKNKKTEETYKLLEHYLGSNKYIHEVLTTMPGARWDEYFFIDSIDEGVLNLKNNDHVLQPNINFEAQEILTELELLTSEILTDFNTGFDDIMFHLEFDNWLQHYNLSLTDLDDKPPIWRYFNRIFLGLDREFLAEINDDFFYFYKVFPYCTLPLFFPGFYTTKKFPYRVAGYKPWTRKPRYIRYIRTIFTPFQKKRYEKDLRIKQSRLKISLFTKILVFSFVFFLIFL